MYPTTNLQPGATGAEVKKLQDYLVSQGYMTQAQVNTGYGTCGPQTTAAVKALQIQLGVDNSTGPGYWGPRTITAVKSGGTTNIALSSVTSKLPADQQKVVQSVYDATLKGDVDMAARIQAAMKAASQYSDPYFKAQTRMVTDALGRGLSAKEGDLAYNEGQLRSALDELRQNTAASKDQLSFSHAQELKQLESKYQNTLLDTQQNLAAAGFASSSRRTRTEGILAEQNQGLVESSNKQFGYQTGNLDRNLGYQEQNTQAQIENLRRLTSEGKLDLTRTTEGQVGSSGLSNLGYDTLGGVGGSIPRQQVQDQLQFASNFVF